MQDDHPVGWNLLLGWKFRDEDLEGRRRIQSYSIKDGILCYLRSANQRPSTVDDINGYSARELCNLSCAPAYQGFHEL